MSVRASKNYLRVRAGASLLILTSHSHDEFCNKFTNIIYTLKKSGSFLGRGEEDTIFYSPLLAHVNFEQSRLEDSSLVFTAALVPRRIFHNRRLSLLCAALPTRDKPAMGERVYLHCRGSADHTLTLTTWTSCVTVI